MEGKWISSRTVMEVGGGACSWHLEPTYLLLFMVREVQKQSLQKLPYQTDIKIFMPIVCHNKKMRLAFYILFKFHSSTNSFLLYFLNEFVYDRFKTKVYCSFTTDSLRSNNLDERWLCKMCYYSCMQQLCVTMVISHCEEGEHAYHCS